MIVQLDMTCSETKETFPAPSTMLLAAHCKSRLQYSVST